MVYLSVKPGNREISHPCSEGYGMSQFLFDWTAYNASQKMIFGKIKDKYPEYLASSLMLMKYKEKIHKEEIDKRMWAESYEKMKTLEYEAGEFKIIAPETKEALEDEARQQHNCLSGYIGKVTRGEEMILFLRSKDDPEKSQVTIEVLPGGDVGQINNPFC